MATLSRTKKYQDLRDRLQHDTSADSLSTNDLSRFEKRLNEIDAQNFSYTENNSQESYSAEHARNLDTQPAVETEPLHRKKAQPSFDTSSFAKNENDVTFDNDYLDQYIREVKQYNIDQGNAASENTSLNILKQIERNNSKTPDRPYPRTNSQTSEIPFLNKKEPVQTEPIQQPTYQDTEPTQPLTKEDIMAEVQSLVNGVDNVQPIQQEVKETSPFVPNNYNYENTMGTDTFNARLEADRTTRQQLLNETTQMRAQLDDYEDNLSEFSDKMRHTNTILNIVLVMLIIALAIIVGFVIYWIVISK